MEPKGGEKRIISDLVIKLKLRKLEHSFTPV